MKSIIPIDETWTVSSFRKTSEHADEILENNGLPNPENPFDSLQTQQAQMTDATYMNWATVIVGTLGVDRNTRDLILDRLDNGSNDLDRVVTEIVTDPNIGLDSDMQAAVNQIWTDTKANLEKEQIRTVWLNLNDEDKARSLAMLDPKEWVVQSFSGSINGYLQVPETLVDERTSVDEATRRRINEGINDGTITLQEIRELLVPNSDLDIAPTNEGESAAENNWFWKPTGDVMFSVEGEDPIEIPCWPESVRDSTSASWSQEMTTYQHYEPKNTYKSSGPRTVSCSFKIHRAMWDGNQDSGDTEKLIAYMESACYPDYETQASEPPRSLLIVGNSIRIKGIMTSFEKTYQGPIGPDNCYDEVILSLSITEESDNVLSTSAVRGGLAGWR